MQLCLPNSLEKNRVFGGLADNSWSFQQVLCISDNQDVLETTEVSQLFSKSCIYRTLLFQMFHQLPKSYFWHLQN